MYIRHVSFAYFLFFVSVSETKKRKYAKETCRIYIEKDQNMQEEKKEKYINGEIYGEKNQIIVANKSAMIRDKMWSK